jgi:hypothetical protein
MIVFWYNKYSFSAIGWELFLVFSSNTVLPQFLRAIALLKRKIRFVPHTSQNKAEYILWLVAKKVQKFNIQIEGYEPVLLMRIALCVYKGNTI